MLTIRLTRKGKKNQPFFRVVVIDKKRSSKGGRAVEFLGFVDPLTKRKSFKKERILHWIRNGAKPSATVHNLLVREKIILGKKINVSKIKPSDKTKVSVTGLESQKPPEVIQVTETQVIDIPKTEVQNPPVELVEPKTDELDKAVEK